MKTIHVCFQGLWDDFGPNDLLYKILLQNYNVVIHDNPEEADYLICSVFDTPYEYCKFEKIRILYSGENYIPDFNLIDYGISSYPLVLGDRHFCKPQCIESYGHFASLRNIDRSHPIQLLEKKKYFANFIAGHESELSIRGDFFKKLDSEYKRVESPGYYLNNMPNGKCVKWTDDSKLQFQSQCKFTLCFESTKHDGFITEKITDAFMANTIPIYYGSDVVKKIFNPKAFINCADFASFDEVIEKIKEIDQDDEKYKEMISQPILRNPNFYEETMAEMEKFVCHIFDQNIENAYRRSRVYTPKKVEDYLLYRKDNNRIIKEFTARGLIKEIQERIKQKFKKK